MSIPTLAGRHPCCRPDFPEVNKPVINSIGKKHEKMRQQNRWEKNIFTERSVFCGAVFFSPDLAPAPQNLDGHWEPWLS